MGEEQIIKSFAAKVRYRQVHLPYAAWMDLAVSHWIVSTTRVTSNTNLGERGIKFFTRGGFPLYDSLTFGLFPKLNPGRQMFTYAITRIC